MRIEIKNIEMMKQAMDAISTIVQYDEAYLNIRESGLALQSVNGPGHHIVHVEIPKEEFDKYDPGDNHILHVNVNDLSDAVKLAKSGDTIIFEINRGEFKVKVESEKIVNEMVLALLSEAGMGAGYRPINIAGSILASNATIKADLLLQAMKTAKFGDGLITFVHEETGLEITSQNEAMSKKNRAKITYSDDNSEDVVFSTSLTNKGGKKILYDPIHTSSYDLENVKTVTKFIRAGDEVKFSMSNVGPMRMVKFMDKVVFAVSFMPIIERII